MIEPTGSDLGRRVVYARNDPHRTTEFGLLRGFNRFTVFVLYDNQPADSAAKPTDRADLDWETP